MTVRDAWLPLVAVLFLAAPAAGADKKDDKGTGSEIKTYALPPDQVAPKATTDVLGGKPKGPAKPLSVKSISRRPEAMADEKLEEAIDTLNQIIESTDDDDPSKPEYLARLAELYWDKAENYFNKAYGDVMFKRLRAAQEAQDAAAEQQVQTEQAGLLKQRQEWQEKTVSAYRSLVERFPGYRNLDQVLFYLGYTLVQMDRQEQAYPFFARIVREAPNSQYVPDALLNIGEFYFNNGRMDDAEKFYSEVEHFTDSGAFGLAIYKKGWCYYNMGVHEDAMNQFLKVIDYARSEQAKKIGYGPQLLREAQRDLVMVYSQVGTPEKAIAVFKAISPTGYMELALRLAEGYASQGEYDKSTRLYKKIIAEYKDAKDQYRIVEFQRQIVENAYKLGIKAKVVEEARRLIGLLDKFKSEAPKEFITPELTKTEDLVRVISTNYHKEVAVTKEEATMEFTHHLYNEYLRLFPDSAEYQTMTLNYAILLKDLGKFAEAAERFDKIVALKPEGEVATTAAHEAVYAYWRMMEAERKSAKIKSEDASDTEPKELPPFEAKLVAACDRYIAMAQPGAPHLVEARFAAAVVKYQYNRFPEATRDFRAIIETAADHEIAPDAARLLLSSLHLQRDIKGLNEAAALVERNPKLMQGDVPQVVRRINEQRDFNKCYEDEQAAHYLKAAECFLAYVRNFPDTPWKDKAYIAAATDFFKARQIERSLQANGELVNNMPESPLRAKALFNIADTYRRLAVYSEAAKFYETFVKAFPKHELTEEALRYATIFRSGLQEYEQAIKDLRRYLELFPKSNYSASVAFEIGSVLEKQGKHPLAQKEWEGWLRKYDKGGGMDFFLRAHLKIAQMLRAQKKEKDALNWYKKTVGAYEALTDDEKAKVTPVGLAAAAEAQFMKGEALLDEMAAVKLSLPEKVLTEGMTKKINLSEEGMKLLNSVEAFGQPNWTIAAFSRKGFALQGLAESIEKSPAPPLPNEDAKLFYRQKLADKVQPIRDGARDAFKRCVEVSRELKWYNKYSDEAEQALMEMDPDFRALPDIRPAATFFTLNAGRPTLLPEETGGVAPKWADAGLEDRIQKAAKADKATAAALYNQAVLHDSKGDHGKAVEWYQKALGKDPKLANAVARLGVIALEDGRGDEARGKFDQALALDPANSVAHNYQAGLAIADRNFPEAINHARMALVSDPDSMDAYLNLAASYYLMSGKDTGILDLAVLVARNAVSLDGTDAPIQNMWALILLKQGEVRQAVRLFEKATKDDPQLFDARMNFGAVTLAYKDFVTAADQFGKAAALRKGHTDALMGLAVATRGLGKGQDAQKLLSDLAKGAAGVDAHYNLCILYQETLSEDEKALAECNAFLAAAPAGHGKRKEAQRRLDGIKATIEVKKSMGAPAPAPMPAPDAAGKSGQSTDTAGKK